MIIAFFTYSLHGVFLMLLVDVDDVIILRTSLHQIDKIKKALHDKFTIKDLNFLKYLLGLEVSRSANGTLITQRKFIVDLLAETGQE